MAYYLNIDDGKLNGGSTTDNSRFATADNFQVEVSEEVYNAYDSDHLLYIWNGEKIVDNPNYESDKANIRRTEFNKDFFSTSLGFIRRKVSMKTGETKDFLTDLLPVISMAVNSGQPVTIITYKEPDFTHDIEDWESLQEHKQATPQFIQECFNQVSADFTGI